MSTASATGTMPRPPRSAVFVTAIVLAVTALTALSSGVWWAVATNSESVSFATERDEALRVGRQAIINFNTLDHHDVQRGLDLWAQSSTGPLHEEVVKGRDANAARIAEGKSTTTAEVLDAAITELDVRAGKARMISVVKVTVTPEGQQPTEKRSRYQAELTREGQEWKLSALGPVSVG
jgi:Mce-associated membrane protein